ncbi:MAG: aminotransferase class I/II-fold pyridoxal phosphate-dependent enzyme [Alphaproteobacteria bacterium]
MIDPKLTNANGRRPLIGVGTYTTSARARELVNEVLDSNRLSYGPMTQRFENEFARLHGCRFGIMSNSGTSALQIALQAMKELHGWADGDEVLVPAVTFVATANIVLHNRMVPVPVDVEPVYYGLDPAQMERAITPRTRAVIPVHLFGQPSDMDPILAVARRHKLLTIEDSCETMFADYNGRRVGSLGDIGCFSTYAAHLIVTGVGGVSTTNNPDYMIKMRSLLNHGRDSIYISIDDDKDKEGAELHTIIERRFKFISVGHSFRVTEMEAALGLAQLEEWEPMIRQRRQNAAALTQALKPLDNVLQMPAIRPGSEHSFMMYPIVLRQQTKREMVNFLEDNGVETRDMLPLTNQPVYSRLLGWKEGDYPQARHINDSGFYVACHQDLKPGELDYIADCITRFFVEPRGRKQETASLVLLADARSPISESSIEALPWTMFAETIVVDDGLPPAARGELERRGARIVDARGQTQLDAALATAREAAGDVVVFYPFNGQWDARDIPRLLIGMNLGHDMVTASRFMVGGDRRARQGNVRSLGNRVFNLLANIALAGNLSDSFSSFRAVRKARLKEIPQTGRGDTRLFALSLEAVKRGWRLQEIPTVETAPSARGLVASGMVTALPALGILLREWSSRRGSR